MIYRITRKSLVAGIIILFIGVAFHPSLATIQPEVDVEPKDYLFQTIIDIANNPNVKELLEQHKNDLLKVDIDKGILYKIFFKNPKLLFNLLSNKPSLSLEYLNTCYDRGIEIIDIFGEDNTLEIIDSIEFTDIRVLNELNNIIMNNEELSERITILEELNDETYSDLPFGFNPIICTVLYVITFVACLGEALFSVLFIVFISIPILFVIFQLLTYPFQAMLGILNVLLLSFNCTFF